MADYAPKQMELAPRHIVTKAIQNEILSGRGIDGHDYLYLDIRHLGEGAINEKLPQTRELCIKFAGIDPVEDLIPVQPTAHYSMGGIPTSIDGDVLADGKTEKVKGLYAAGECACVSIHGANRLGCNSLLEAAYFGKKAGVAIKKIIEKNEAFPELRDHLINDATEEINFLKNSNGEKNIAEIRELLQNLMLEKCGVFRNRQDLESLSDEIVKLRQRYNNITLEDKSNSFNLDLLEALELGHMLDVSEAIVKSALTRTESRGSHIRTDFPERNDKEFLQHSLIRRRNNKVEVDFRPVTVTQYTPQ